MSNNGKNSLTGAQILLNGLVDNGVDVFFANAGTSEMHLVSAIGSNENARPVLCLFEGVVTGAADGYWRMARKPAATLLHLGPGYANGMANLHNAKKAFSGIVNIVGDHATRHLKYDAPLTSDLIGHVKIHSHWFHVSNSSTDLGRVGVEAVSMAESGWGKIATVIAPANHAWEMGEPHGQLKKPQALKNVSDKRLEEIRNLLEKPKKTAFLLGGLALQSECTELVSEVAQNFNASLICETFSARMERGVGRVTLERIPYFAEHAIKFLSSFEQIILVGGKDPVGFFAYPGVKSRLASEECQVSRLVDIDEDVFDTLIRLKKLVGGGYKPILQKAIRQEPSGSELSPSNLSIVIANEMPENSIISDEGITCAADLFEQTKAAPKHDWLSITGGSIGQGLPVSFGASIACPSRKVIAFQADGSAMYTVQTLWSIARENADVTIVILNNKSYAILNIELERLKVGVPNSKTLSMLDLSNPEVDWVSISHGMGIEASRATTVTEFEDQFKSAMASSRPRLIEAMVVQKINHGYE